MSRNDSLRDLGLGLAFLGSLVLIMSVVWVVSCQAGSFGPCLGTPFLGRQGFLESVGLVLFALGMVFVVLGRRPAAAPLPPNHQTA